MTGCLLLCESLAHPQESLPFNHRRMVVTTLGNPCTARQRYPSPLSTSLIVPSSEVSSSNMDSQSEASLTSSSADV